MKKNLQESEAEAYREALEDHVSKVRSRLLHFAAVMTFRAKHHDDSKFEEPEFSKFAEVHDQLSDTTYMSDEYKDLLDVLDDALDHHYANNSHHPEYYEGGLQGFDLFDLVEMFCDWSAAVEKHEDGDIYESIEKNKDRFGYDDVLASIFRNTADVFTSSNQK